ncbi:MAG: putative entry exclusion protein TrbK-alt [Pseudomonadota bacterium]
MTQTLRLIAIGLVAITAIAAVVELAGSTQVNYSAADTPNGLTQCRNTTSTDSATATECRAAWQAARQRFFDLAIDPAGTE